MVGWSVRTAALAKAITHTYRTTRVQRSSESHRASHKNRMWPKWLPKRTHLSIRNKEPMCTSWKIHTHLAKIAALSFTIMSCKLNCSNCVSLHVSIYGCLKGLILTKPKYTTPECKNTTRVHLIVSCLGMSREKRTHVLSHNIPLWVTASAHSFWCCSYSVELVFTSELRIKTPHLDMPVARVTLRNKVSISELRKYLLTWGRHEARVHNIASLPCKQLKSYIHFIATSSYQSAHDCYN